MKKIFILLLCIVLPTFAFAQSTVTDDTEESLIEGTVINATTEEVLEGVNIINLNTVKGTTTATDGTFKIRASSTDTLFFSFLGFKTLQVRVTNDWKRFGDVKVKMTETGIALEEVVVKNVELTGYLEIDAKNVPVYKNVRYSISGLDTAYEAGNSQPGAINKVLSAIFNPADFLNKVFSNKSSQMRKLRQMKEDDNIRNLLVTKFDRETLSALLQVPKEDIEAILGRCDYSQSFVKSANDLQILDALSSCYEEYKVLNRDK
ncbi:carboxypeptidase-like regulatory domain-containing protein [Leeuwenhoekiella aequorea]|uniref:Carboxypeptidase-like protein n=1 Tax=Leeuwenhoekiella aequorea TaxID=283736 RepID=A0A4Q0PAB2_9FLAO|nr:carboxypeptidase-like regulatory domain-containing protein [Leeuwenhoekiella aequorea]RXG23770.1 carboxypeptidase-like protein [Leeuwenhoekiella aequorea]|tara:strand:- start:62 stop:847 length:786 start_codon:yes stop_codon:yes gene_type:complete